MWLLMTSVCSRRSQVAITSATEVEFEILPHPQYSPDMAPYDFCLFPKLKSHLSGTKYGSNEGVIEVVNEYVRYQGEAFYFEGIRKHCLEGRLYWKAMVKQAFPGSPKYKGPQYFLIIPHNLP